MGALMAGPGGGSGGGSSWGAMLGGIFGGQQVSPLMGDLDEGFEGLR